MRKFLPRILTGAVAILLLAAGVRADALADKVPADALIFASWSGTDALQAQYGQSRLKSIMDSSTIQSSFAKVLNQIEHNPQMDMQGRLAIEAFKTIQQLVPYPTALYVGPFASGAQPMPQVALICQAGKDSAAIAASLQNFVPPGGPVTVVDKNGFVLVEVGDVAAKLEATMADPTKSLSGVAAYKAALGQVQKDAAFTTYVDIAALVDQIDMGVTKFIPPGAMPPGWTTAKIRAMLNLDGFTQAAMTSGFDGKDWGSRGFVGLKGDAKGLTALFTGKPLDQALLKNAPETANWLAAGRMDFRALYDQVMDIVKAADPNADKDIADTKAQVKAQLGIDIETDLIRPLGDQWLVYTAPNVNGTSITGLTLVSPLKDAGHFGATVDTLAPKITSMLAQQGDPRAPFHMSIEQYTTDGIKVTYANVFLNPAMTIHDGKLYAGLSPQGLVSAIDASASGKSILDNSKYTDFVKRLGVANPSTLTYMDLSVSGPDSYAMISTLVGMVGVFSDEAKPTMLPPLSKLYPHLTTAGSATWNDAAGWHSRTLEPFPGSMIMGGGQQTLGLAGMTSAPLMVAVMLPSLGRARELANRTAEAANLHGCLLGCVVWAADNNDAMPESLAQIVAQGTVSPKSLVSKRSNTQPMEISPEQAAAMGKDWKVLLPAIDDHTDFVYLGKGTKNTMDSSFILMYTDPAKVDVSDGMNVGFGDGHVEWMRAGMYKQMFEQANHSREAIHLPALKLDERGLPVLEK